ncbi:GtrA family protein [Pseudomonas sp. LD120]|uniref:GtrA family protein n=1 Tax=Pseudomonas sp. LD120 TaxID=485751 RepID=UPI00135B29F6|nr:GtrA family protein [Pseudomonas sp. LD120]KAF0862386.1 GtrA family protein [Pseudomonas sp. LD120]
MLEQFKSKQFLIFLLVGGFAAAVNFGSRFLYNYWVSFSTAVVLSYITGMTTAFLLSKLFVFKESTQRTHHSILYFILVNIAAILQTLLTTLFLAYYALPKLGITHFAKELSHAVGVIVPVFTSYLGHKRWSFR